MTIDNLKDFEKIYNQIRGKKVFVLKEEPIYHYENVSRGYDHLGHLGYEQTKVIDSYEYRIEEVKINKFSIFDILFEINYNNNVFCSRQEAETAKKLKEQKELEELER